MSSSTSSSSTNSSSQYPEAIQLKLYQAFIFSIPILFSIILFLLFYLFYLKRRRTPLLPTTHTTTITTQPCNPDLKNHELNNKLCQILFEECMKATSDSLCCVCLGEFEVKEELVEIVRCKHIFHIDCIMHWLHNNSTCPLCRAPVNFSPENNNHFYSKYHHPNFPIHHHPPPPPPPPPPPSQILQMLHYTITSSHHAPSSSSTTNTSTTS